MSSVRVAYSGLIAFAVSIVSVITGTVFVIIVTRRLAPEDFGLWTLIGGIITYVVIVKPIITYWSVRQISRGENVAKTSVMSSGLFSIAATIAFIALAFYFSNTLEVDLNLLLFASILVPLSYLYDALSGIAVTKKPQTISYSLLAFEVTKIPIGILLVVFLDLELFGAIATVIVAETVKTTLLFLYTRHYLHDKFNFQSLKFWLKMSWLTMYETGSWLLKSLDVFVISILSGSLITLAYWGVSQTIATIISHSAKLTQGLYPKLLATGKKEFTEDSIKRTLLFAIPILAASIVFAKPGLYILNPVYIDGVNIVILLSIRSFVFLISSIAFDTLRAYDPVDIEKGSSSFREYMKSKLFFLPTLNYIFHGIYIAALVIFLRIHTESAFNDVQTVEIWSAIFLAINIPLMIYGLITIHRKHRISLPFKSIAKFSIVTLIYSLITHFVLEKTVVYTQSIYDFLPQLIPIMVLGGCIYFGLIYLVDEDTKKLFKSIFRELKK